MSGDDDQITDDYDKAVVDTEDPASNHAGQDHPVIDLDLNLPIHADQSQPANNNVAQPQSADNNEVQLQQVDKPEIATNSQPSTSHSPEAAQSSSPEAEAQSSSPEAAQSSSRATAQDSDIISEHKDPSTEKQIVNRQLLIPEEYDIHHDEKSDTEDILNSEESANNPVDDDFQPEQNIKPNLIDLSGHHILLPDQLDTHQSDDFEEPLATDGRKVKFNEYQRVRQFDKTKPSLSVKYPYSQTPPPSNESSTTRPSRNMKKVDYKKLHNLGQE